MLQVSDALTVEYKPSWNYFQKRWETYEEAVDSWIQHAGYDGEVNHPKREQFAMPNGYGYKRKFASLHPSVFQRNVRPRNTALGRFRGRTVRRYGNAPFRTGGFRAIRAGRGFLNNPSGRTERKFLDYTGTADPTTTGSVEVLNAMAQGTSQSTRVGNKIHMTSIQGRLSITNGTVGTVAPVIRYMIIYDTQTNAALPALLDILTPGTVIGFMNLANRDRFRIIWERTFTPSVGTFSDTAAVAEFTEFIKIYQKLNLDVVFNNTNGGTIADIQTGSLLLVTLSNVAAGTGAPVDGSQFRLRYTDL